MSSNIENSNPALQVTDSLEKAQSRILQQKKGEQEREALNDLLERLNKSQTGKSMEKPKEEKISPQKMVS